VDVVRPPAPDFLFHGAANKIKPWLVEPRAQLVKASNPDEDESAELPDLCGV